MFINWLKLLALTIVLKKGFTYWICKCLKYLTELKWVKIEECVSIINNSK